MKCTWLNAVRKQESTQTACAMVDRKNKLTRSESVPPATSPGAQAAERRLYARFPFTAEAIVTELRSQTRVAGRSSDLGSGGCYIDTMSTLPVGTGVRIQLKHEHRTFEALAIVAYAHHSLGMGLSFVTIEPNDRTLLEQWIAPISDAAAAQIPEPPPATTQSAGPQSGEVRPAMQKPATLEPLAHGPVVHEPVVHEMDALSQVFKMRQMLNELISLMIRKRLIDQKEAANLLQQIYR